MRDRGLEILEKKNFMTDKKNSISLRAFLFGTVFSAVFAALTIYFIHRLNVWPTDTQIPVMPYILLIVTVALINPVCRLIRIVRAFTPVEIMVIFVMGMVSAGLSTFGLAAHLVPVVGGLFNSDWNNKQSEWNRYVVPYLNDKYFVAEPGIQAEAIKYKQALKTLLDRKTANETARLVSIHVAMVAACESALAKIPENDPAGIEKAKASLASARNLHDESARQWQDLCRAQPALPDWKEVIRIMPPEIEKAEQAVDEAEKQLIAIEEKAFAEAAVFRRGLPRDESAFPGILPLTGDDRRAYFGRLHRLLGGLGTLRRMKEASVSARLLPADVIIGPEQAGPYCDMFARSAKELLALCNENDLQQLKERLDSTENEFNAQRMELTARLKSISDKKLAASRARSFELAAESDAVIAEMKWLDRRYKHFKKKFEIYHHEMDCLRKIQALAAGIEGLREQLSAGKMSGGELAAQITSLLPAFPSIDVSLRRYFIGQVPWACWLKPLSYWALVIGLTYIVLMSLNVLIFRQWAHNERLTYPLAELPKALAGEAGMTGFPPIFRNSLFWAGAAISMSVLGWNLFCSTQIVPGLTPLDLNNRWFDYVNKTQFESLRGMKSEIFFTMVGLSFLVPKNISFSLWFFFVIYMVQVLIMVWTGHGQSTGSFAWDWWYQTNFRSAQGQGALIVFSGFVIYKARKYILCSLFPSSVADLEDDERKELKLSSIAFLGCSLGLILMLWLSMGANLYYTILFYVIILVITIGLVRVVAEGGLLSFQCWGNPIHYLRNFFGLDRPWTSASLFAPLMVYYAIIFLDIKTFIAPAMANALKLREDYRLRRFSFHVIVAVAIVVAALSAVIVSLLLSYDRGADAMNSGFFVAAPRDYTFNVIRSIIKDAPASATENIPWTLGGAVAMAALLFFRQFFFWMPHPIGLIMFVNPIMNSYWFSIFLGWIFNVAITKYGNKDSFYRAKGFFIGLIIGELIMVAISCVLAMSLGTVSGITLNRNQ